MDGTASRLSSLDITSPRLLLPGIDELNSFSASPADEDNVTACKSSASVQDQAANVQETALVQNHRDGSSARPTEKSPYWSYVIFELLGHTLLGPLGLLLFWLLGGLMYKLFGLIIPGVEPISLWPSVYHHGVLAWTLRFYGSVLVWCLLVNAAILGLHIKRSLSWHSRPAVIALFSMVISGLLILGYIVLVWNQNSTYMRIDSSPGFLGKLPESNQSFGFMMGAWWTDEFPETPFTCSERVSATQRTLFTNETYRVQFARTRFTLEDANVTYQGEFFSNKSWVVWPAYNFDSYEAVRNDRKLCDQGFIGNADMYGLGIRCGLYLQWFASIAANNLLSPKRKELQNVYLIFSLALACVVLVSTFTTSCVFAIEIEILYWMYWGGLICVIGSGPSSIRLGNKAAWAVMDWRLTILYTTHGIMVYHAIWYSWFAYDLSYARMPCGTIHFFLAPALDPSEAYWRLRDFLTVMTSPILESIILGFPVIALLQFPEFRHTIRNSFAYQLFFPNTFIHERQPQDSSTQNLGDQTLKWYNIPGRFIRRIGMMVASIHEWWAAPTDYEGRIRLVTPLDAKKRKLYRLQWATIGIASYALTIAAIELTLKWNKVQGVNTIDSFGQFIPLFIGIFSLCYLAMNLVKQEGMRRRIKRRQLAVQLGASDTELGEGDVELTSLHSLSEAVGYAYARPDVGILGDEEHVASNLGEPDFDETIAETHQEDVDDFMMSGANRLSIDGSH